MSSGCVHQKASVILAGGFLLGSLFYGPGIEYAAGALVGIMLTPDLDVDNGYIGNTIIERRLGIFGKFVSKIWDGLWYFYRKSLKHGSELSHFPIISTLFRLGYLYVFLIIIPYTIFWLAIPGAWSMESELHWWNVQLAIYYRLILGLMGSDLIHWALDILTTEHAKQKKKAMIFGMQLASSTCR